MRITFVSLSDVIAIYITVSESSKIHAMNTEITRKIPKSLIKVEMF